MSVSTRQLSRHDRVVPLWAPLMGLFLCAVLIGCGGGGGGGDAPEALSLRQFLLVDRALNPVSPTGSTDLDRNAQLMLVFSEELDPATVNTQTIQLRTGPTQNTIPNAAFRVSKNVVFIDPTLNSNGTPNPYGFDAFADFRLTLLAFPKGGNTLHTVFGDPLVESFETSFRTSDRYLREVIPPEVEGIRFVPGPDPLTGNIPARALLAIDFSEPMDPTSVILGANVGGPDLTTSVDLRYSPTSQLNQDSGVAGLPIPVRVLASQDGKTLFLAPVFSFGDANYEFQLEMFQGLTDLAGNKILNPQSAGPFVCDGTGSEIGVILAEDFTDTVDRDALFSDADWGATEEGVLGGLPVSSRRVSIYGYTFTAAGAGKEGQYALIADPLQGEAFNQFNPNIQPPTEQGRRVQWAFSDDEMGASGVITGASWGPDQNSTVAAHYPIVRLRAGYQRNDSMTLSESFAGNYEGTPSLLYGGAYNVTQAANVGNAVGHPTFPEVTPANVGANCAQPSYAPLFNFTGWFDWPQPTGIFEWEPGDPNISGDRVMIFDASVAEGDNFQILRGWFGATFPCSGVLIPGFPLRRMYSTFEADTPNPPTNFGGANPIQNPRAEHHGHGLHADASDEHCAVLFLCTGGRPATERGRLDPR